MMALAPEGAPEKGRLLFRLILAAALMLAACSPTQDPVAKLPPKERAKALAEMEGLRKTGALQRFDMVVRRMLPVIERECRARGGLKCRFAIVVDANPKAPPNAFMSLDRADRPVIVFTGSLLKDTRNEDELALVLGHEVAHHLLGHVPVTRESVWEGALLGGIEAATRGGGEKEIHAAEQRGALKAVLGFSKKFEIEADQLGAILALKAGFDPVRGAEYFVRMKNPRNRFLSTHPPNSARRAAVRRVVARYRKAAEG